MKNSALEFEASLVAAAVSLVLFGASTAWAQDKQVVKFEAPAANTKYTQQHSIPVGDVPGHDIRIFENIRTFPSVPLVIEGVRVEEWRTRGFSDFTESNGPGIAYHTLSMENGDKIYMRASFVAHSKVSTDGLKKGANNLISGPITGGNRQVCRDTRRDETCSHLRYHFWFQRSERRIRVLDREVIEDLRGLRCGSH